MTIWAVTSCGYAVTPRATTPWSPAATMIVLLRTAGSSVPWMPAICTDSPSRRPRLPGGFVSIACRATAARMASASAGLVPAMTSASGMTVATTCPRVILANMHRMKLARTPLGAPSVAAARRNVVTLKGRALPTDAAISGPEESGAAESNIVITCGLSTRDNCVGYNGTRAAPGQPFRHANGRSHRPVGRVYGGDNDRSALCWLGGNCHGGGNRGPGCCGVRPYKGGACASDAHQG